MEKINDSSLLFMMMYKDFMSKFDTNTRGWVVEHDELMESIEAEGFVERQTDAKFIYGLYNVILNSYAKIGLGEVALAQMWQIFAKLEENGVMPTDQKAQALYLHLAKRLVESYRQMSVIDIANKRKFMVAGLDSFDTTKYYLRALKIAENIRECSAFYAYYADFLREIASVGQYEALTYALLAEHTQIPFTQGVGWSDQGKWVVEQGKELRDKLYFDNHFSFSPYSSDLLLGKKVEEILDNQLGKKAFDEYDLQTEEKELAKYPGRIRKPSKRLYLLSGEHLSTTDVDY